MSQQRSEVSRDLILSESLKLFLQHGYHAVSLNQIVDSLGISKGRLTYHFPKKEILFGEVLDYFFHVLSQQPNSLPESLRDLLKLLIEGVFSINDKLSKLTGVRDTNLNYHRLFLDAKDVLTDRDIINTYFRNPLDQIEMMIEYAKENREINNDTNSSVFAFQILSTVEGIYVLQFYQNIDQDQYITSIVDNLMRGVSV